MRTIRYILVLAACLHLCGSHYGVIQMFAWGKMIVDYSAEKGFATGVREALDGEHPCDLCNSIATAKENETAPEDTLPKPEILKLGPKHFLAAEFIEARKPRAVDHDLPGYAPPELSDSVFRASPDSPPPRIS